eukprot:GDKK01061210.1.p1 GENE.GDKK01061210.1~~GDKK01061210.1.p1  ORF type:complete len:533 (+),score=78.76 GDKK01061210.1:216-1601(+)
MYALIEMEERELDQARLEQVREAAKKVEKEKAKGESKKKDNSTSLSATQKGSEKKGEGAARTASDNATSSAPSSSIPLPPPRYRNQLEGTEQYLIVLRVSNSKVSITDDSSQELTNRWLIVVDLQQKIVFTFHRVDTEGMTRLRQRWFQELNRYRSEVMGWEDLLEEDEEDPAAAEEEGAVDDGADLDEAERLRREEEKFAKQQQRDLIRNENNLRRLRNQLREDNNRVSFQQFLLKLLDDAVATHQTSLDVHKSIVDVCETKIIFNASHNNLQSASARGWQLSKKDQMKVLNHFEKSSDSREMRFLRSLVNTTKIALDRNDTNTFLYHLHRRSNVQHRTLIEMKEALHTSYQSLRLCSPKFAEQLASFCSELAAKAEEIRDDAQHLLDMHISLTNFRTNELMTLLTKFEMLFSPLAFLAGVYGTNFGWVPEYQMEYGYFYFWGFIALFSSCMYWFFIRTA